jgi:heptosyltransferase-2
MHKRSLREIQELNRTGLPSSLAAIPASAHHLNQYLHLVAALGANPKPIPPKLEVTQDEVAAIKKRYGFSAGGGTLLFGLNPGAEYGPAKRWPRERFAAAAIELQRRTNCHWWIFGGSAEEQLGSIITAEVTTAKAGPPGSVRNLAGQTSLRELCAGLKACAVVITNDTGPMHIAAAVGTPVVVPFGSTSPELTGPGLPNDPRHRLLKAQVACSPCFLRECPIDFRCMNGITVRNVVEAAMEFAR